MDIIKEQKIREKLAFFKLLDKEEEKKLNLEEYCEYRKLKRFYNYVHGIANVDYSRAQFYSLSYTGLAATRLLIDHNMVKVLGDERENNGRPFLYCVTHIGKFDYQIVSEVIKDHAFPLVGDAETLYRTFDGDFFEWNGNIYCDTYDPLDCYVAEQTMIQLLQKDYNGMIYPEAFWNLSPNLLVMPIFPGVVRMAISGNADIIPVAIEQYGHKFYVKIGKNFIVDPYAINDKRYIEASKNELRNIMASLKLDIMKYVKTVNRSELGDYEKYLLDFREQKFNECLGKDKKPLFSMATIEARRYRPKDPNTGLFIENPEEAFAYLKNIPYNEKTSFMFKADEAIPSSIGHIMHENREKSIKMSEGGKKSIEEIRTLLLKYK